MHAVNWNKPENMFNSLWRQNVAQMWTDTEFKVSRDVETWNALTEDEQDVYKKVLAGLTGLDTLQGDIGMPIILLNTDTDRKRAVYSFMAMMEHMHAKSYSTIFTSLLLPVETDYLIEDFTKENDQLVNKADLIEEQYQKLLQYGTSAKPRSYASRTQEELVDGYMARVASVLLESFLFYSGFYYPLYLKGQGKMTSSGEIIRKILIDESIHGVAVGLDAQDIYEHLNPENQEKVDLELDKLLDELYLNEEKFTKDVYTKIGLEEDVLRYIRYNANKALANLGKPFRFEHEDFSPIVNNALDVSTSTHDFFSVKGDGYEIARHNTPLSDDDFDFTSHSLEDEFII